MLAETPQPDGGLLLVIILVVLGILAMAVATMALGCLWAWKAGRGSQLALGGWVACFTVEGFILLFAVGGLVSGKPHLLLFAPALAVAAQVALYLGARGHPRPGP